MIPIRALYLPIHMHNFYNVRPVEEVIKVLEDQHEWGYNTLVLWYDVNQYADPFAEVEGNAVARKEWEKQRRLAERARRLGMAVWMISVANVIYVNQAAAAQVDRASSPGSGGSEPGETPGPPAGPPAWTATPHPQSGHTPQHVCPSIPAARETILANHDQLFAALPGLSAFIDFAYDWGGCGCEKCAPWASTYYDLLREKAEVLHRHVPDAPVYACDWHFTDDEVELLSRRIREERPTWLAGVVKDDRHPIDRWRARGLPSEYPVISFFDITMIGGWGTLGAQPFPRRIATLMRELRDHQIGGVIAYTEGIFDGANKALTARLAQDPDADPGDVLRQYARKAFGLGDDEAGLVAEAAALMEEDFTNPMSPWWDQRFAPEPARTAEITRLVGQLDTSLRSNRKVHDHWEWQSFLARGVIENFLTVVGNVNRLREAVLVEMRLIPDFSRMDAIGAATQKAREVLHQASAALEALAGRIVDLREKVYGEPATRFPAMAIDESMFEGRWGNTYEEYLAVHRELSDQLRQLEACTTVEEAHRAARRILFAEEKQAREGGPAEAERWGVDGQSAPGSDAR